MAELSIPYLAVGAAALTLAAAVGALANGALTARRRRRNGDDHNQAARPALVGAGAAGLLLVVGGILCTASATPHSTVGLPYGGFAGTILDVMLLAGIILLLALVPAAAVLAGLSTRRPEHPTNEGDHDA